MGERDGNSLPVIWAVYTIDLLPGECAIVVSLVFFVKLGQSLVGLTD